MKKIVVPLGERSYDIVVAPGVLDCLGELIAARLNPTRVAVVADGSVAHYYGERVLAALRRVGLNAGLASFPAGENSKSLAQAGELLDRLFALELDRQSCVVALGGGVTGDLAGFTASLFMRGISFVQVPTTLLAMVDSSSGGKTGVNHPAGKNLIGAFHQPALVVIDPAVLATLPPEELRSGLAEVVKHGVIRDAEYFAYVARHAEKLLALDLEVMTEIILGSCRIKGEVVAADEREAGLRAILNFGHTFGHAYETLSEYKLRHGEAVAMGMVGACRLAELARGRGPELRQALTGTLLRLGLPVRAPDFKPERALAAMLGDKKAENRRPRFVLPVRLGEAEIVFVNNDELVLTALADLAGR